MDRGVRKKVQNSASKSTALTPALSGARYSRSQAAQAGFTLVEVLIAMFIFSLITLGSLAALTSALRGKDQLSKKVSDITNIELSRVLIKSDMSHIVLPVTRDIYGNVEPYVFSGGVSELLSFSRAGRTNPGGLEPRGDLERVRYVFEGDTLIRRSLSHAHPAPNTPVNDRVLIDGLRSVDIRFHAGDFQHRFIEIAADNSGALPDYIEFDMMFLNGDKIVQYFELAL